MTPAELRAAAERLREGLFPEQGAWRTSDIETGADALERLADVIDYLDEYGPGRCSQGAVNYGGLTADDFALGVTRVARGEDT